MRKVIILTLGLIGFSCSNKNPQFKQAHNLLIAYESSVSHFSGLDVRVIAMTLEDTYGKHHPVLIAPQSMNLALPEQRFMASAHLPNGQYTHAHITYDFSESLATLYDPIQRTLINPQLINAQLQPIPQSDSQLLYTVQLKTPVNIKANETHFLLLSYDMSQSLMPKQQKDTTVELIVDPAVEIQSVDTLPLSGTLSEASDGRVTLNTLHHRFNFQIMTWLFRGLPVTSRINPQAYLNQPLHVIAELPENPLDLLQATVDIRSGSYFKGHITEVNDEGIHVLGFYDDNETGAPIDLSIAKQDIQTVMPITSQDLSVSMLMPGQKVQLFYQPEGLIIKPLKTKLVAEYSLTYDRSVLKPISIDGKDYRLFYANQPTLPFTTDQTYTVGDTLVLDDYLLNPNSNVEIITSENTALDLSHIHLAITFSLSDSLGMVFHTHDNELTTLFFEDNLSTSKITTEVIGTGLSIDAELHTIMLSPNVILAIKQTLASSSQVAFYPDVSKFLNRMTDLLVTLRIYHLSAEGYLTDGHFTVNKLIMTLQPLTALEEASIPLDDTLIDLENEQEKPASLTPVGGIVIGSVALLGGLGLSYFLFKRFSQSPAVTDQTYDSITSSNLTPTNNMDHINTVEGDLFKFFNNGDFDTLINPCNLTVGLQGGVDGVAALVQQNYPAAVEADRVYRSQTEESQRQLGDISIARYDINNPSKLLPLSTPLSKNIKTIINIYGQTHGGGAPREVLTGIPAAYQKIVNAHNKGVKFGKIGGPNSGGGIAGGDLQKLYNIANDTFQGMDFTLVMHPTDVEKKLSAKDKKFIKRKIDSSKARNRAIQTSPAPYKQIPRPHSLAPPLNLDSPTTRSLATPTSRRKIN